MTTRGQREFLKVQLIETQRLSELGVTGVPPVCFASKRNRDKQKVANLP